MADLRLIHRDDIDMDVAAEIEKRFAELYPGFKVTFAGDIPDDQKPAGLVEAEFELKKAAAKSLMEGVCMSCGAKIPAEWPPESEGWKWPPGWGFLEDISSGQPMCIECGDCGRREDMPLPPTPHAQDKE